MDAHSVVARERPVQALHLETGGVVDIDVVVVVVVVRARFMQPISCCCFRCDNKIRTGVTCVRNLLVMQNMM